MLLDLLTKREVRSNAKAGDCEWVWPLNDDQVGRYIKALKR